MTQINKAYITNSEVNSGSKIDLLANDISFSQEVFTSARETPSKSVSDSYDSRLGKGIYTGFNNPNISIKGTFKLNETHGSGEGALLDYEFIQEMVKRGDIICTLECEIFKTTSNTTGEINVMLKNMSISNGNSNIIDYSMSFIEVRSDS